MREGWKGQKIQWMDTNNVIESISVTCGYKTLTHLVRLQSQTLSKEQQARRGYTLTA